MARFSPEMLQRARDTMALYPDPKSALIPLCHLAQEQDGWLTAEAVDHIAELLALEPVEVLDTASFYDMLFTHPVGTYLLSVCTNLACLLAGGYELLEHAERQLGVKAGGTSADGDFTLEEVECVALCGQAPCATVNWRFFGDLTPEKLDALLADLRSGALADVVPPHGTLNRVRRSVGLVTRAPSGDVPPGPHQGGLGVIAGGESREPTVEEGR